MRSFQHWITMGITVFILIGCGEAPASEEIEDEGNDFDIVIVDSREESDDSEEDEASDIDDEEPNEDSDNDSEAEEDESAIEPAPVVEQAATSPPPPVEEATEPLPPPTPESIPFGFTQVPPQLVNGETAVLAGTAPKNGASVTVVLWAGPHQLVETNTLINDNGNWQVELSVPYTVYGAGRLQAIIGEETAVRPIPILPSDGDPLGVAVNGVQPSPDTIAVSGAPLFFSGNVTNAINRKLTVSYWINDCTEPVASQSITLGGEAVYWNASIILPQNLADEQGCASISTGDPSSGEWREQIIPMQLLQLNDEATTGLVTIGNRPDKPFAANTSITLFGTALNLPEPFIEIEWIGEGDNPVFIIFTTDVDNFGYWNVDVDLPEGLTGLTTMIISSGEGEGAVSSQFKIPITP